MGKTLVVVESPNKISKIQSFLGSNYIVKASCGIIMDLNPKSMSIDFDNNFEPIYKTTKDNIVCDLRKSYKCVDNLIIATDDDREGEMIGWTIAYVLKVKDPQRIIFRSITKKDILNAISNPTTINYNMVNAQKGRRVLDRLVGYTLSPLLMNICPGKLSAGRVQSVVVKVIIDRENEIKNILTSDLGSFYRGSGSFKGNNNKSYNASLHDLETTDDGVFVGDLTKFKNMECVQKFFVKAVKAKYMISAIYDKVRIQNSQAPFETSTLQQESSTKLRFSTKKTMDVAQRLYEAGLITYMRTDSTVLSDEAMDKIKKYVLKSYGEDYYKKSVYKTKSKNAQEAHEAIRPTNIETIIAKSADNSNKIGNDEIKLYSLIWKRTVASQMKPAEYSITTMQISIIGDIDHFYLSSSERLIFDGYLIIYDIKTDDKKKEYPSTGSYLEVNNIKCDEDCKKPPVRYNDASLVKKIGPKGLNIVRPSTSAPTIDKIKERGYVEKKSIDGIKRDIKIISWDGNPKSKLKEEKKTMTIGKDTNKYCPTDIGITTNNFLVNNFPKIMDHKFTADMEKSLDKIAKGKLVWNDLIGNFYDEFKPLVAKCKKENPKVNFSDKYNKILSPTIAATVTKYGPVVKKILESGDTRYVNIDKPYTYDNITLEQAEQLLKYPKLLGNYKGNPVNIKKGPFGFYINCGIIKISAEEDTPLDEAIKLLDKSASQNLAMFHDKKFEYSVIKGKYGKYIRVKTLNPTKTAIKNKTNYRNIKLPKNINIEDLTLDSIKKLVNKKS